MIKITIKPSSIKDKLGWMPDGMVQFPSGQILTERRESYKDLRYQTKDEADNYFEIACEKKYKTKNHNFIKQ